MTARRYWRIAQPESYAYAGLDLSDVALYAGVSRVDGSATLTCPVAPSSGTLSALSDGAFTPTVRWDELPVLPAGFALVWDFGVGTTADITSVGIAGPEKITFLHRFVLQSSDDGAAWSTVAAPLPASKFPGGAAFYTLLVADYALYRDNTILLLTMDGPLGGTMITDLVGNNRLLPIGAAQTSTAESQSGGSSLYLDGASYLRCNTLAALLGGTYTLEGWFYLIAAMPGNNALFGLHDSAGNNIIVVCRGSVFGVNFTTIDFATAIALGGWHHVAVCVTPTGLTLWIDGAFAYSAVCTAYTIPTNALFSIGQEFDVGPVPSDYMNGYVDFFRVTNGVVRYTAPFTPPNLPDYDPTPARSGPYFGPHRMISAFMSAGVTLAASSPAPASMDMEHGGRGRVIGTTKNTGSPDYPVSRRVRLARKRDGVLARETWSDAAGNYLFEHVRHDIEYVVTSHDHTGLYNAVIADSVTPELMP